MGSDKHFVGVDTIDQTFGMSGYDWLNFWQESMGSDKLSVGEDGIS